MTRPAPTIEALCDLAVCSPDSAQHAGCQTFGEEVRWFADRLRARGREPDESAVALALLDRDERLSRAASHTVRIYP